MARRITALHKAPLLGYFTMAGGGAPAATPWYLSGGVSAANCIAAYQPIGAASYAASKVNLANPGTHDLTDGSAPSWDTNIGWTGASGKYLVTDLSSSSNTSMIARFSDATEGLKCIAGYYSATGGEIFLIPYYQDKSHWCNGAGSKNKAPGLSSGVLAVAGRNAYRNSTLEYNNLIDYSAAQTKYIYVLCENIAGADRYFTGSVQALAIYDTVITADQVAAITTAMAALTSESKSQSLEGLLSFEPEEEKLWWQGADVQAVEEEKPQTFWQKAKKFIDDKLYQLWQAIEDYFDYHEED